MSHDRDPEKADYLYDEHQTSSSSSDSSTSSNLKSSPPSTPPDDDQGGLPRIQHAPHSSNPPRRGNRRTRNSPPNTTKLGAIDEDSSSVAPDIPTRNPARTFGARLFGFGGLFTKDSDADVPPPNVYDKITGPRGEKFADVRKNRTSQRTDRRRTKKILCIAVIVALIVAIVLAVGLGVGLTRKKNKTTELDTSNTPSTSDSATFPIGKYDIPTYLASQSTNCSSNAATWRCYPYSTYTSSSPSSSFSTLLWQIWSPTSSTLDLQISNTDSTFSYPFNNVSLTLSNTNDARLSAFTFSFVYRKQVVPSAALTSDNSAARCYFNNTQVSVRLYSTAQGAGGSIVGPPAGAIAATTQAWPYAIEYSETSSGAPECFKYANGVETTTVPISAGSGNCQCAYRNYGL